LGQQRLNSTTQRRILSAHTIQKRAEFLGSPPSSGIHDGFNEFVRGHWKPDDAPRQVPDRSAISGGIIVVDPEVGGADGNLKGSLRR
jgi:hypothetical protein